MDPKLPTTFIEAVKLIGNPVFIGVAISLMIREWVWFASRKPNIKVLIVAVCCIVPPILSQVIILYLPAAILAFIEYWWPFLMVGVGAFIASQIWHEVTKKTIRQEPAALKPAGPVPDPENGLNMPA